MSELVITLLRLGFLVLLWVMVLSVVAVLRRDVAPAGARGRTRGRSGRGRDDDAAPDHTGRPQPVTLSVLAGPLQGTRIGLGSSAVLIGRSPAATLVIDDDYASGRHARIFPHDGAWLVEDLGSTNGSFLDGARIGEPVVMHPGSQLQIGQTIIELQR